MGRLTASLEFARSLGFAGVWQRSDLPLLRWDAVIDASNAAELPALALELVEPGKRVVYLGLAAIVARNPRAKELLGYSAVESVPASDPAA